MRDADSPLLEYLDLDKKDQQIILMQKAVDSEKFKGRNVLLLETGEKAETNRKPINYDEAIDAIFSADKIICV